jgi:hypothetical protein
MWLTSPDVVAELDRRITAEIRRDLALQASRRVREQHEAARRRLLDHGVNFLIEDGWRNPWSTDPLRPRYRGRPYPVGKQIAAQMRQNGVVDQVVVSLFLDELQDRARARVARDMAEVDALSVRRLRAASAPLAVVEPRPSLPTSAQTVAELEKRCYLPIEEIRGCFRQGRRSAEQQATREIVEGAVRAMVRHYRMRHPHHGSKQLDQQRATWKEYAGSKNWGQRETATRLWAFGDSNDDIFEPEGNDPAKGHHTTKRMVRTNVENSRRAVRKSQIQSRLAEALGVDPRTIRRIVGTSTSEATYTEEVSIRQESSR